MVALSDAFPREITKALDAMGDYVYAYYRPDEFRPFYVGKGRGVRVLAHWRAANAIPTKAHELEINAFFKQGVIPTIKLLAYNLEDTSGGEVYSTVERVLQDAFGIQLVWEKRKGGERLVKHDVVLMQTREDSAKFPVLSLEAVLAKVRVRPTVDLHRIAQIVQAPVMMVGLSKTYHPSYGSRQVSEMARMYWALEKFENTSLPPFRSAKNSVLVAWSSLVNGSPMIVGAWRVVSNPKKLSDASGRYAMRVEEDLTLRQQCLGLQLEGTGNNWQGPRFAFPE